jgi:ferredoxin-NADP reductase
MPPQHAIVEFVGSRVECGDVWSLSFTRPEGYSFVPGQAMSFTLETREGPQTKFFSHCDAPGDETSRLVTRATGSAFKDALLALQPGDTVPVLGPYGRLTVPGAVKRAAFLVGGVGITPAASIIRDAVQRRTGLECLLLYGNTSTSCIPLRHELAEYMAADPRVHCVHVLSAADASWDGERGMIDAPLVRRHCDPLDGWHWFISGTPGMVTAMRAVLAELAVPSSSLSYEEFAGYGQ